MWSKDIKRNVFFFHLITSFGKQNLLCPFRVCDSPLGGCVALMNTARRTGGRKKEAQRGTANLYCYQRRKCVQKDAVLWSGLGFNLRALPICSFCTYIEGCGAAQISVPD